jgi:hypothetical protein
VGGEVEGGLVVVGREDSGATREGDDGGEPDAAAKLDGALAGQGLPRQAPRQRDRARPELSPVRKPLLALEISLVYEGISRGGMEDAIGPVADLNRGLGERGAAAEVYSELVYQPTEAASRATRPSRSLAASWAMV